MGVLTISLTFFALYYIVSTAAAAGSCPLASKVYGCNPKCVQNYDCNHGKVCCPNSCNTKSCVEPSGNAGGDKYSQSGATGIYCGNVKCSPHEKCITDPSTKRQKCGRS